MVLTNDDVFIRYYAQIEKPHRHDFFEILLFLILKKI